MPGIYGYIKDHKSENQIADMTTALMHQESFVSDEVVTDDYLQFSHIHLDHFKSDTKIFCKNGVYIAVEGEQYDCPDEALEVLIFQWYSEQRLDQELNRLDGYFNAVVYDSEHNKLTLVSDRYGMRMLYYYLNAGRFAWSCEVKGLLALSFVDKTIDQIAFDSFVELGYIISDKTWFEKIKLIDPATIIEFDLNSGKSSQRHYWSWAEIKPQDISFEDSVNALGSLFLQAVEKRFDPDEKVGIALSGGLDSRAIFAAVNHLYPDFKGHAYTFGVEGCDDIEIAKLVANQSEWKHKIYYFSENNWFAPRIEKIWETDGMLDMMHMHGSEFLDDISSKLNINLNGYAADVVCGGGWLNISLQEQKASAANLQHLYGTLSDCFDYDDAYFNIEKVEPHLLINKVRRFTNMGSVCGSSKIVQRKPFFDNAIIEFIYSLPDEYRMGNRLYSIMLLKFFPDFFSDIPWQKNRLTLSGKSSALLKDTKIIRGYINYAGAIREPSILESLNRLLKYENSEYCKYSNVDAVEQYLQPHIDSISCNYIDQIFRFATAEIYLKRIAQYT